MTFLTLKRLLSDYREFHGNFYFYGSILFWAFLSIFITSEPFLFSKILWLVEDYYKTQVFQKDTFIFFIFLWGGYIVISLILTFLYRYFVVVKRVLTFYSDVFQKYSEKTLFISYNTYLTRKQGEIYKRFDSGTDNVFWFLMEFYNDLVKTFVGIFVVFIALFFVDWRMALALSLMMPILIYLGYYTNAKTSPKQRILEDEYNKVFWDVSDSLTNMALVKTLTLEKHLSETLKQDFVSIINRQFSISRWWTYASLSSSIVIAISRLFILSIGIYFISQDTLQLATLFLFYSLTGWIYFPLSGLFERMRNIQKQVVAIEKFYAAFDGFEYELAKDTWKKLETVAWKIEFRDVTFSYTNDREILKWIQLTINPWEKVALVGNTGAGKSTLVNLLFRLWDVEDGGIYLDGEDTRKIQKKSLRKHIGIVMQDNTLFNTSIRNNLLLVDKKATQKDIESAIKKAKADFVFKLKDGLDTLIWERGLKLSGWEKQRINIARLLLKDPKIIILDEATSALDNSTELEIQKSLDALMKGRTSIIIAHRLSTIKHADRICVLENGKVVEEWKYEELMQKQWKFFALANPDKLII